MSGTNTVDATSGTDQLAFPAATLADAARELWGPERILGRSVQGAWRATTSKLATGRAHTVRIARAHEPVENAVNDWFAAFDDVADGSLVVVEVVGDVGGAAVGDAALSRLKVQGARGLIVDGDVRDFGGMVEVGLPTWVRGTRVYGMLVPQMRIETGVPIRCGGVDVAPGDLVAADPDGIFVVPGEDVAAVCEVAQRIADAEERMFALIGEGNRIRDVYSKTGRG